MLMLGVWVLICIWLFVGITAAQTGIMIGLIEETGYLEYRMAQRLELAERGRVENPASYTAETTAERRLIALAFAGGSAAIGLVAGMLWAVIFPHWRRNALWLCSMIIPAIALIITTIVASTGGFHRYPTGPIEWLLIGLFALHVVFAMLGATIGRPTARQMLSILLPPRPRTAFSYLWMADGKPPPAAKA